MRKKRITKKTLDDVLPLLSPSKRADYTNGDGSLGHHVEVELDECQRRYDELRKISAGGSMSPTTDKQKHGESSVWHRACTESIGLQSKMEELLGCKDFVAQMDVANKDEKRVIQNCVDTNTNGCLTELACDAFELNDQWVVNSALRQWTNEMKAKAVGADRWTDALIPLFVDTYTCQANDCR